MTQTIDTKVCPYCAETIKAAAIKCRYCHSELAPEAEPVAPAAAPVAPAAAPRRSLPGWVASSRLVVALSVLALLLTAGVGYLAWDLSAMNDDAEARLTGRDAAASSVQKILSYDHASFDKGTADAERLMTPRFRKEYDDTVALVRKDALAKESVVHAEVVASSVVTATSDRVEALLFVNQTTDGKDLTKPRVDLNRVVVTLVPDGDGGWLVDGLDAL